MIDDSWFRFAFRGDSLFEYQTLGHVGDSRIVGNYKITKDTLFLTPFPKKHDPNKPITLLRDTLIIKGTCISELSTRYIYCELKQDSTCYPCRKKE